MGRITWNPTRYSSVVGAVNGRELFKIHLSTRRGDPKPYNLDTDLPVYVGQTWKTLEGAQQHAETVLAEFVASLGAVFPEPEQTASPAKVLRNDDVSHAAEPSPSRPHPLW